MAFSSASIDNYSLRDNGIVENNVQPGQTTGTVRSSVIDPTKKTLVLIVGAAQSNWTDVAPTIYVPTNYNVVDNFNIYNSAIYSIDFGLQNLFYPAGSIYGHGNACTKLADTFVSNSIFDRVIIVDMAVGNTNITQWSSGVLKDRGPTVMKRLASVGITPLTLGVKFACLLGMGENDSAQGTSQINYFNAQSLFINNMINAGFSGRFFVCQESYVGGSTSTAVRNAQAGVVDNITIFSAGDLDTLTSSFRNADNLHFNDSGLSSAAGIVYSTMHASGSPF